MLWSCVKTEQKKLRHSHLWLAFLVIPLLPAFMGAANYVNNLELLKSEWYSLWTQHSLFYANFFYAPLIGVYCSYLWRLEHMGHNWNLIMAAPVRPLALFLAKYAVVLKLVLLTQLLVFGLYVLCGKAFAHLPGWPPVQTLLFLLRGLVGGQCVIALQLVLSMLIRSFAVPVFIGLAFPYALMQVGMNANKSEDLLAGQYGGFLLASALWLALFLALAHLLLTRRDVHA